MQYIFQENALCSPARPSKRALQLIANDQKHRHLHSLFLRQQGAMATTQPTVDELVRPNLRFCACGRPSGALAGPPSCSAMMALSLCAAGEEGGGAVPHGAAVCAYHEREDKQPGASGCQRCRLRMPSADRSACSQAGSP